MALGRTKNTPDRSRKSTRHPINPLCCPEYGLVKLLLASGALKCVSAFGDRLFTFRVWI